jgi:nitroreductase
MSPAQDLYQAILARRSVRRYAGERLDAGTLAQVEGIVDQVRPLVPENRFDALLRDVYPGEDLVRALGAYGLIVSPPHYLVPYAVGEAHVLTDLGYRVQQIAVRLVRLNIGSCYVGSVRREEQVRTRFGLPQEARIGAFLTFGYPATALGGRAFNALMRSAVGATNKLPANRIFHRDTFDQPAIPPGDLGPLIEAARHAPSASNTQPWRFLWRDETLYLFVRRRNMRYAYGLGAEYRLYDGGICMANVTLAMETRHVAGQWHLLDGTEPDLPDHPAELEPLARIAPGVLGAGRQA